jgi:hypothetical protein
MKKQILLTSIISATLSLLVAASFNYVFSWQEPDGAMPSNYTNPIVTNEEPQTKKGDLTVSSIYDYQDTSFYIDPSNTTMLQGLSYGGSGDVNQDGDLSFSDIFLITDYLSGEVDLTLDQKIIADINGDGDIDILDAQGVNMFLVDYSTEEVRNMLSTIKDRAIDINQEGVVTFSGDVQGLGKIESLYNINDEDDGTILVNKAYVDEKFAELSFMDLSKRFVGENPKCPAGSYSKQRNYDNRVCSQTYNLPNSAYGLEDYCGRTQTTCSCTTIGGWSPTICSRCVYCCGSTYSNHVYWNTQSGNINYKCIPDSWSENECVSIPEESLFEGKSLADCESIGGETVFVEEGVYICRIQDSVCPSGWSQYQNWSTTNPGTGACPSYSNSITTLYVTSAHLWSNVPVETSGGGAVASVTEIGCY